MYRILSLVVLALSLLIPTISYGQPEKVQKNWLFATHLTEKSEKFVGVLVNEETCRAIAGAMNEWAKFPPVTPLFFFCKQEPVKA